MADRQLIERMKANAETVQAIVKEMPSLEDAFRYTVELTQQQAGNNIAAIGFKPEALEISVTEDTLTIKGETEEAASGVIEGGRYIERHYGTFSRTLQLPCRIRPDQVEATYAERGLLRIRMPKCRPAGTQVVKIQII